MASITACSTNLPELLRRWLLLGLLLAPLFAWAAEIEVANPQLAHGDDGYTLSADFRFELRPRLEEAVARGVVLPFVVEYCEQCPGGHSLSCLDRDLPDGTGSGCGDAVLHLHCFHA